MAVGITYPHDQMGVRDRAAARARDEADPRQLGSGRLGTGPGRTGTHPGESGGVFEAAAFEQRWGDYVRSPSSRLSELGVTLPAVAAPLAAYVPAVRVCELIYSSGQLPIVDGALLATGKVGDAVTLDQAADCARTAALNEIGRA